MFKEKLKKFMKEKMKSMPTYEQIEELPSPKYGHGFYQGQLVLLMDIDEELQLNVFYKKDKK